MKRTIALAVAMILIAAGLILVGSNAANAAPNCQLKTEQDAVYYENDWTRYKVTTYVRYDYCIGDAWPGGGPYWFDLHTYGIKYSVVSGHLNCHKDRTLGVNDFSSNIGNYGDKNSYYNPPLVTVACQNDGFNEVSHGFNNNGRIDDVSGSDKAAYYDFNIDLNNAFDIHWEDRGPLQLRSGF